MDFFETLYGDCTGWLQLFPTPDSPPTSAEWPENDAPSLTPDLYYGVTLKVSGSDSTENGAVAMPGLWADCDLADKNLKYPTRAELDAALIGFPEPTMIVSTGFGLHIYWLFREPWVLSNESDRANAKALCQRLQSALRSRLAGKLLDSTHDLARKLRVPGTLHSKSGRLVEVLSDTGPRHNPNDLDDVLPLLSTAAMEMPSDAEYEEPVYGGWSLDRRRMAYESYLRAYPSAVEGEDGSKRLLLACGHRHGFGVPAADALELLLAHYNPTCMPPWSDKEIIHKLKDARPVKGFPSGARLDPEFSKIGKIGESSDVSKGWKTSTSTSKTEIEIDNTHPKGMCVSISPPSTAKPSLEAEDPRHWTNDDYVQAPYLWDGIVRLGDKAWVAAAPKSHKSFFAIAFAQCVAAGLPYWSRATLQKPVLVLNTELRRAEFANRWRDIAEAQAIRPEDMESRVCHLRGKIKGIDAMAPAIVQTAKDCGAGLIVLDPIYKFYGSLNENDAGDMSLLCSVLESITEQTGATLLCVHHFAKGDASKKSSGDRMSGSGVMHRDADALVTLTPGHEDFTYSVEHTVRNGQAPKDIVVKWEWPLLVPEFALDPKRLRSRAAGRVRVGGDDYRQFMAMPLTRKQLTAMLMEKTGCSSRAAETAFEELEQSDWCETVMKERSGTRPLRLYRKKQESLEPRQRAAADDILDFVVKPKQGGVQ